MVNIPGLRTSNDYLSIAMRHLNLRASSSSSWWACKNGLQRRRRLAIALLTFCTLGLMQGNLAQASAQEGFVSVDCGAPAGKYTDNKTSIEWMSDAAGQAAIFVSEGVSVAAPVQAPAAAEIKKYDANEAQRLSSVRYFPGGEQSKYCYVFSGNDFPFVQPHTALLVRAAFWAGNLTFNASAGTTNTFQLLINADIWDDVSIALPQSQVVVKEAYMLPASNTSPPSISVCLAGKGAGNMTGIPFVSSLELRLLPPDFYNFYSTYFRLPMHLVSAVDYGAATDETAIRFPDDPIDRIWQADTSHRPIQSTSREIATDVLPFAAPALHVLQTAYVQDEQIMLILPVPKGANYVYYVEMYIFDTSETQEVSKGQRVFALQATGYRLSDPIDLFDFRPLYYFSPFLGAAFPLRAEGDGHLNFTVTKAANSTYGPLINALQLFRDFGPLHPGSNGQDIDAISFLQTNHFKSLRRWSGDPCSPYPYNWLTCTADESPRVSNLLLSNRGLNGNMPTSINFLESLVEIFLDHNELSGPIPDLGKLQKLQTLDLSNNNFSGQIPTALANLPRLETLILDNNSFEGEVPQELLDKFLNPKFKLSFAGNPLLCTSRSCTTQQHHPKKFNVPLVASLVSIFVAADCIIAIIVILYFRCKRGKTLHNLLSHVGKTKEHTCFSYNEVKSITNNFKKQLGVGGFGPVYYGELPNDCPVAVKVLAAASHQGEREFLNEVNLLSRIHHKNLVRLLGHCVEEKLVLIYEYMSNGSLLQALRGTSSVLITWKDHLRVAVDASEGLEYLHNGCNPKIIHRDVKSSNILLDQKMRGKLSDFGISRSKAFNTDEAEIFTPVQGSFGYLDPEIALGILTFQGGT